MTSDTGQFHTYIRKCQKLGTISSEFFRFSRAFDFVKKQFGGVLFWCRRTSLRAIFYAKRKHVNNNNNNNVNNNNNNVNNNNNNVNNNHHHHLRRRSLDPQLQASFKIRYLFYAKRKHVNSNNINYNNNNNVNNQHDHHLRCGLGPQEQASFKIRPWDNSRQWNSGNN